MAPASNRIQLVAALQKSHADFAWLFSVLWRTLAADGGVSGHYEFS
jgi:hypothetical protein